LQFVSCLTYKREVGHVRTEKMWADLYMYAYQESMIKESV